MTNEQEPLRLDELSWVKAATAVRVAVSAWRSRRAPLPCTSVTPRTRAAPVLSVPSTQWASFVAQLAR